MSHQVEEARHLALSPSKREMQQGERLRMAQDFSYSKHRHASASAWSSNIIASLDVDVSSSKRRGAAAHLLKKRKK
ncbi:hypothetical protein D8674_024486 [Pyrus ussuriensis x Pyrus communis]|uniref:Uncharacterized protein n=1 Tax=Pyrus ussuriensis x Pyrus communis TaxID=2448454 RepID=A0A5N5HGK5_9ROSA|nr:hypothetical protein D8674_024486 [Pyrus ussuriensis x Pyrus communis]